MRILHVTDTLDPVEGGPSIVTSRLAAAQAVIDGGRHEVAVFSYRAAGEEAEAKMLAGTPGFDRVRRILLARPGRVERVLCRAARRALMEAVPSFDVVQLHSVWKPVHIAARAAAVRHGRPYVLTPHGAFHPEALGQSRLKKAVGMAMGFRAVIRDCAYVHALSAHEQELTVKGGFHRRAEVIPNGVFLAEFDRLPARGSFRASRPALGQSPYVVIVARLHPHKGIDILIDALAILRDRFPSLHVVAVGPDFGAKAALEAQIDRLGLRERVHLTGPIYGDQKLGALVDAECFALPSLFEGFSIAIAEALACSVPVVISRDCNFPEVALAGAGLVVERTPAATAEGLARVLSDPKAAGEMRLAARRLIEERYTWEKIAQRTVELYSTVVR